MRRRRATENSPAIHSAVPQVCISTPATCRGVVRQSSAPVTRAALASAPLGSATPRPGVAPFAASLRAAPASSPCPAQPTTCSARVVQPASGSFVATGPRFPSRLTDGAASPLPGGEKFRNGPGTSPIPLAQNAVRPAVPGRNGSATPSQGQPPPTLAVGSRAVVPVSRSGTSSPPGCSRTPPHPGRALPASVIGRAPPPAWRGPSPSYSPPPGSPAAGGCLSVGGGSSQACSLPVGTSQPPQPSSSSRSSSPRGNVSWRVMPPPGSMLAASAEGIRAPPTGSVLRQLARPSMLCARSSAWNATNGSQVPSPVASPGQSVRNVPAALPIARLPTAAAHRQAPSCEPIQSHVTPFATPPAPLEEKWRPPWLDDTSESAWTAASELEAAAAKIGLLGEGEVSEHKWFIDGLQKGFMKKARREEADALALAAAKEAAAEAALARCREELRAGAEQRLVLEEVLSASQASRNEMTEMVAQVAEVKQRMTEEMAQQALEVGMELRLHAQQALGSSLGRKNCLEDVEPWGALCSSDKSNGPLFWAPPEPVDEKEGLSLGTEAFLKEDAESYVQFNDDWLPVFSEEQLRSMPPTRLYPHAVFLLANLGQTLELPEIPEASSEIVSWILSVQQQHLEMLPDLDRAIQDAKDVFDSVNLSSVSVAPPSSLSITHSTLPASPAAATAEKATTRSNQLSDRHTPRRTNRSPGGASSPVSPVVWASASPASPPHLVATRCSPAPSLIHTSPATSTRSGMTPCGSARKLADNAVRTLPAPGPGGNPVCLRLADRLGTGSPPVGPVRIAPRHRVEQALLF